MFPVVLFIRREAVGTVTALQILLSFGTKHLIFGQCVKMRRVIVDKTNKNQNGRKLERGSVDSSANAMSATSEVAN